MSWTWAVEERVSGMLKKDGRKEEELWVEGLESFAGGLLFFSNRIWFWLFLCAKVRSWDLRMDGWLDEWMGK